jgi:hypothetical protein
MQDATMHHAPSPAAHLLKHVTTMQQPDVMMEVVFLVDVPIQLRSTIIRPQDAITVHAFIPELRVAWMPQHVIMIQLQRLTISHAHTPVVPMLMHATMLRTRVAMIAHVLIRAARLPRLVTMMRPQDATMAVVFFQDAQTPLR